MLRTLKNLLDALAAPTPQQPQEQAEHMLQLAAAVLLVEVMRADSRVDATERSAVIAALRAGFTLSADEVDRLMELAEQTAQSATDYYTFTSKIVARYGAEERVRLLEHMFRVAYADQHLSAHENHLMRKVASLLHVSHGDYVAAKLRAKGTPKGA
jgi:uncharacterized tellurite resistance protein B-like protein